jgi:hypothetical protein
MAKRLPFPRDFQTLIQEIGRAVTIWQHLENGLGELFCVLLGEADRPDGPGRAAYCSVLNFGIRLDMIDAAVRASCKDDDLLKEWINLYSALNRKSKIRNRIVHASMVEDQWPRTRGHWLAPSPVDVDAFFKARRGIGMRADASQVYIWTLDFDNLGGDVRDFHSRVQNLLHK